MKTRILIMFLAVAVLCVIRYRNKAGKRPPVHPETGSRGEIITEHTPGIVQKTYMRYMWRKRYFRK